MTNSLFNTCAGIIRSFMGNPEPAIVVMDVDQAVPSKKKPGLFAQCNFALIRTTTWPQQGVDMLASELKLHDGEVVIDQYPETGLDLNAITHVVSDTYDFPDYNACSDALIPVVKLSWVANCLAKDKLVNPRQYSPDPRYFMSDVCACIADLPAGDADAIAGGVLAMGGLWSAKLTNQVTHIITLSMDSQTVGIAEKRRLPVKVVLPHWVDDCLKLGRKIDEHPYQLPDPEILKAAPDKPPMGKRKTPVEGALHPDPIELGHEPAATRKLEKVFRKKSVMLADDLGISPYLRGILDSLITTGGGKVTTSASKSDMFICKYREGRDYKLASRAGKDVGNLAWLYYLIQTDEWTSPGRRMLHYPIVKEGLPGFPGLIISLSNYSGDARSYLENLINAAGATATKTLKQDNTHLITAHDTSEKCAAAREWGVHIVNHLWLEESYARWKMQSVTDTRYTHFPQRTNLGDLCGSTQLDRGVLMRQFFPDADVEMADAPSSKPMRQVDRNSMQPQSVRRMRSEQTPKIAASSPFETPSRLVAAGKENITPTTTNSRKSKDVAASRLHQAAEDIALFEKERKRVGGVVYGGRRKTDPDRIELGRKRSMEEMEDPEMSDDSSEAKRLKRAAEPPQIRLVISKYDKWVNKAKDEDRDKKQLRSLGIMITLDPRRATHLAAPNIVRTQKFVTALAYAPLVVSTEFIDACLREDELLDPEEYILKDKENEKKFHISLADSRRRAEKNANRLLEGRSIYVIESITGGFETFKGIVEANGGRCMLWKNRKGTAVPSGHRESEDSTDTEADNDVYLLSDDNKANEGLWLKFREMVESSRKVPKIVKTDWILETAMSQQLRPTKPYEL